MIEINGFPFYLKISAFRFHIEDLDQYIFHGITYIDMLVVILVNIGHWVSIRIS